MAIPISVCLSINSIYFSSSLHLSYLSYHIYPLSVSVYLSIYSIYIKCLFSIRLSLNLRCTIIMDPQGVFERLFVCLFVCFFLCLIDWLWTWDVQYVSHGPWGGIWETGRSTHRRMGSWDTSSYVTQPCVSKTTICSHVQSFFKYFVDK